MTTRSTRSSARSRRSARSASPRNRSSKRSGISTRRSWPYSTDSSDARWASAFRKVLAALEDLLHVAVNLLESERELRGHGMDASVHADRFHGLQELDVQEGLRRRLVREERLVEGERVHGPL